MALESRPESVIASGGWYGDYGNIGWYTWLRLRDYKAGPLIEEYSTWGNTIRRQATLRTFTGFDSQRWENNSLAKTGNDSASYTLRWERECQMIER